MKTSFVLMGTVILTIATAWAGPEQIIKQRAKELRDQNNVRQGVAPPTGARPNTAVATAPATPSPGLTHFSSSLGAIKPGTPATAAQKEALVNGLLAATQGAKPSRAAVEKFVDALTSALSEKQLSDNVRARLIQEVDAILNPAKYPQAKMEGIIADVQAIFQQNGVSRTKAVAISEDLKALTVH